MRPEDIQSNDTLASWLDRIMESRGWGKSELARKLDLSHGAVWAWMNGKSRPNEANIKVLSALLQTPAVDIYRLIEHIPDTPRWIVEAERKIAQDTRLIDIITHWESLDSDIKSVVMRLIESLEEKEAL